MCQKHPQAEPNAKNVTSNVAAVPKGKFLIKFMSANVAAMAKEENTFKFFYRKCGNYISRGGGDWKNHFLWCISYGPKKGSLAKCMPANVEAKSPRGNPLSEYCPPIWQLHLQVVIPCNFCQKKGRYSTKGGSLGKKIIQCWIYSPKGVPLVKNFLDNVKYMDPWVTPL